MHDLKARGIHALKWDFLGKLSTQFVTFGVTLVLARVLEPSDFGLIALIMVLAGVGEVFIDGGLGLALIQRRHLHVAHYSAAFIFNITVGAFLGLLVFVFAGQIAAFYDQPKLGELLQVASVLFLLSSFGTTQRAILRKELNNKRLSQINVAAALVAGVIGIALALTGFGVWALLAQILANSAISAMLLWVFSDWYPKFVLSWKALKGLWGFGFRMFLAHFIDTVYMRVDYLIIGKLFPIGTLGLFQRAKSLNLMVIQYTSGTLASVLFPVLSKIQKDLLRFQTVVLKGYKIIVFVSCLLFGGLYITAEPLIVILFSEKWRPAAEFFAILALSGLLYPPNAILVNVLSSRGNSKVFLKIELLKKALGVLNLAIGFSFGLYAYLYGLVLVAILGTTINILFAAREGGFESLLFIKELAIQVSVAVLSVIATLLLYSRADFGDFLSFIVLGATYVSLYWVFSALFSTGSYREFRSELAPVILNYKRKIMSK